MQAKNDDDTPPEDGIAPKKKRKAKVQHAFQKGAAEELRRRINERVAASGLSENDLCNRAGFHHSYFSDITDPRPGKKRKGSLSHAYLPRVAAVLDCDEEYLTLKQATPRRPKERSLPFGGWLKTGRWDATHQDKGAPLFPNISGMEHDADVVYVQEDEMLSGLGIHANMLLYAKKGAQSAPGDIVVIRRKAGPVAEFSARLKVGNGNYEFRLQPGVAPIGDIARARFDTEIAVVRATFSRVGRVQV